VGILKVDRSGLRLDTSARDDFPAELPAVVASVVERLRMAAGEDGELAQRALYHLYKEVTAGPCG
jgi:hypothetical protein